MQPLVNTCMTTLSEGSDALDDFVCPCCPVYTASHLIMTRRGKNYETELRHHRAEG